MLDSRYTYLHTSSLLQMTSLDDQFKGCSFACTHFWDIYFLPWDHEHNYVLWTGQLLLFKNRCDIYWGRKFYKEELHLYIRWWYVPTINPRLGFFHEPPSLLPQRKCTYQFFNTFGCGLASQNISSVSYRSPCNLFKCC